VKYLMPDGNPSINPSPFPTALVVWRKFDWPENNKTLLNAKDASADFGISIIYFV
jgi:hypothetical protein